MKFNLVKKFWRLILGISFFLSGMSYLQADPTTAYPAIGLGIFFFMWHCVHLVQTVLKAYWVSRKIKRDDPNN